MKLSVKGCGLSSKIEGFCTEDEEKNFRVRQSIWMYSIRWVEGGWRAVESSDNNQRQLHSLNTHRKAKESGAQLPEDVASSGISEALTE